MIRARVDRLVSRLDGLPSWVLPVVVALVAALVRAATLLEMRASNPLARMAILDDRMYLDVAAAIGRGELDGAWFLAPLFPYLLAWVTPGAAPTLLAAGVLNVVAGTLAAVAAALAARTLHSATAGWASGLLVALAGTFVFHDVLPGQEPLLCLLHVVGFWAAIRWVRGGDPRFAAAVGLAAGLAALGRGTGLSIVAGASVAALLHLRPPRRVAVGILVAAVAVLVAVAPASWRNHAETGAWSPLPPKAGIDLYMSNNPVAREGVGFGAPELGMSPTAMAAAWRTLAETAEGRELTTTEVDRWWLQRTWDERGGVGELSAHGLRKALLFFAASEYGSNHFVAAERRYATWLTATPVSGWWLLALGLGGWWLLRRRLPAADAAVAVIAFTWLALTVFYPVSRYRLPVLPLAAVLAGAGAVEALAATNRRRLGALVLVCSVACAAHADRLVRPAPEAAVAWVNLASAHVRLAEDEAAHELLVEAIDRWPGDGPAHYEMARLLLRNGRAAESLSHLDAARLDARTKAVADVPRVGALLGTGDVGGAERLGQSLLARLPPVPTVRAEMLAWWALTADALGNGPEARRRLDGALRLDAENDVVRMVADALR